MRSLNQIIHAVIFKPLLQLYLKTEPTIRFERFKLKIRKGVFHPRLFFSTQYLYSFLSELDLQGKKFLDIGSGSGIISMLALDKGAHVTAIDLNPVAVENTRQNVHANFTPDLAVENIKILQSDLFSNLQSQVFDVVAINPPYYFRNAESDPALAWYCGAGGEYFHRLFSGIAAHVHGGSQIFMTLEENCEVDRIKSIAVTYGVILKLVSSKKIKWERNFIFQLETTGKTNK